MKFTDENYQKLGEITKIYLQIKELIILAEEIDDEQKSYMGN